MINGPGKVKDLGIAEFSGQNNIIRRYIMPLGEVHRQFTFAMADGTWVPNDIQDARATLQILDDTLSRMRDALVELSQYVEPIYYPRNR